MLPMKIKNRFPTSALLVITLFFPIAAMAQQFRQTTDGAQQFLAQVIQNGSVNASASITGLTLRGTRVRWGHAFFVVGWEIKSKETYAPDYNVTVPIRHLDPSTNRNGNKDTCMTKVPDVVLEPYRTSWIDYAGRDEIKYTVEDPKSVLPATHLVDWRKSVVSRGNNSIQVSVKHDRYSFGLVMGSGDPELLDRVEYAMKFLQMSCDPTADTGF